VSIIYYFPIAPMLISLIIPIFYCIKYKKDSLNKIIILTICSTVIILLYPLVILSGNYLDPTTTYLLIKFVILTILPIIVIAKLENWKIKQVVIELGVNKKNLSKSIFLSILVLLFTLFIGLIILWGIQTNTSLYWNIIMFLDAFNEELFFRGVLLIYLCKLTNIKIAFPTSVIAFILAHPHQLTQLFIVSTIVQGILLGYISYKTKNIIGPWISHGLNRTLIQLLRVLVY
jgi:membrane protease YdiL (CAAX protease family)